MKKLLSSILPLAMLLVMLAGCPIVNAESGAFDIETAHIGVMTGTTGERFALESYPTATIEGYGDVMDAVAALKADKLSAVITANVTAIRIARENPDLEVLPDLLVGEPTAAGLRKEDTALLDEINALLRQWESDGTLSDMKKRWLESDPSVPTDIPEATGEALIVGCTATRPPFVYMDEEGRIVGFAPELARRMGHALGRKVEFVTMEFSALISALQSGKVDVIVDLMTPTEERKLSINFSDSYYTAGQVILKRKETIPDEGGERVFRAEDFEGKLFAVWSGPMYDVMVQEAFERPELLYFNGPQEVIEAVRTGKAYATMLDEPIARKFASKHPDIMVLYPTVTKDEYGIIFGKQNPALRERFNAFLMEIKENGVYDDLIFRWIDTAESPDMQEFPSTGEKGKIVFATTGIDDPFAYIKDGRAVGFDVEIAYRFAQYMDMELEITLMDFGGMIPAVQSGKADFAGDLCTITEPRKEFIDFSEPYYIGGAAMVVKDTSYSSAATTSRWGNIKQSFEQNLIKENRWLMLVKGLNVTLMISLLAFVLATLIGFCVCFMRMSRNRLLRGVASIYITLLRGTPVVVLLMITYYIVFAKVNISSSIVAIIAFGANGGALIGEIIRSAILTVDKGQVEAARSMGFSKIGAFFAVTFPQAARVALPVYKSEFITMVKATAVVGYIAIVDITKAGDIIRSRTYDAFFPLIVVALVYLASTGILISLFDGINKLTDKRQRRARA